jgi:hypothetical protein
MADLIFTTEALVAESPNEEKSITVPRAADIGCEWSSHLTLRAPSFAGPFFAIGALAKIFLSSRKSVVV